MTKIDCPHKEAIDTRFACQHLIGSEDTEYARHFIGEGLSYNLICEACAPLVRDGQELSLLSVCLECFDQLELQHYWQGIEGKPEVYYEPTALLFSHRIVRRGHLANGELLDIQPASENTSSIWIGITADRKIAKIDLDTTIVSTIAEVSESELTFSEHVSLTVSEDGKLAALVNTVGSDGVVFDLTSGRSTFLLNRGEYRTDVTPFSVAFFMHQGNQLLVHGTEWNRLDISDPYTGRLLTERRLLHYDDPKVRPEHYLDYFHGRLFVSPNQQWIADDGWVWAPVGMISSWSLKRWMEVNWWESEDGESKKMLCQRSYCWGLPVCWINDRTIAIWGYGDDDELLIPAVRLVDVVTGSELRWFAGPEIEPGDATEWTAKLLGPSGNIVFDKYLFSCSRKYGITVWDVEKGACLHTDESSKPIRYHRGTKEFISFLPDGSFKLSKLTDQK